MRKSADITGYSLVSLVTDPSHAFLEPRGTSVTATSQCISCLCDTKVLSNLPQKSLNRWHLSEAMG